MPFTKDVTYYQEYEYYPDYTGYAPVIQQATTPQPQNYSYILQQILDTLKEIKEKLDEIEKRPLGY